MYSSSSSSSCILHRRSSSSSCIPLLWASCKQCTKILCNCAPAPPPPPPAYCIEDLLLLPASGCSELLANNVRKFYVTVLRLLLQYTAAMIFFFSFLHPVAGSFLQTMQENSCRLWKNHTIFILFWGKKIRFLLKDLLANFLEGFHIALWKALSGNFLGRRLDCFGKALLAIFLQKKIRSLSKAL